MKGRGKKGEMIELAHMAIGLGGLQVGQQLGQQSPLSWESLSVSPVAFSRLDVPTPTPAQNL